MPRIVHLHASTLLLVVAAVSIVVPASIRADDDIKLKDGTKIIGTIVGFEDNSFKVKTSYGYALVEKDQVVSIVVTNASKSAADRPPANAKTSPAEKPKAETALASPAAAPTASSAAKPAA